MAHFHQHAQEVPLMIQHVQHQDPGSFKLEIACICVISYCIFPTFCSSNIFKPVCLLDFKCIDILVVVS